MGLKLERIEGSRFGFFNSGRTTACLKAAGMQPEERMRLINSRRMGATVSKTAESLNRREGRQSEGQFEGCRCLTALERENRVMGSNCSRTAGWGRGGGAGSGVAEVSVGLSAAICSIKNFRKLSQRAGEGTTGDSLRGFMREFSVWQRTWGL